MTCQHFGCTGTCRVASSLASAMVFPSQSQCDYCTQKALPSQDINKVTVSLALSVNPSKREEILGLYRHLLIDASLLKLQREHWNMLHTTKMDAVAFAKWLKDMPKQCDCSESFQAMLQSNPPRFNDWNKWTWEIHNAVNRKLNKPELSWDDAVNLWGWHHFEATGE